MLAVATAAAAALAALVPAASAQWIQFVTVPLCRDPSISNFSPTDFPVAVMRPVNVVGSAVKCLPDPYNASQSVYYELAANKSTLTGYACTTPSCTACTRFNDFTGISSTTTPDCVGGYFELVTSTDSLDDAIAGIQTKFGGAALASALVPAIVSRTNTSTSCGSALSSVEVMYIFEECTQATSKYWFKTIYDDTNGQATAYYCPASDCQSNCLPVDKRFKPAPPGQTTCHVTTSRDML
ncbi:hypothetical protein HK105_205185 [Polyrhizophydium stewartii]|uniref:Uncharacterized protein n=1 Tax=Polyrhizophydium stewartii TaxID=2732419 RepID=A0ABR4N780_9FUNG